MKLEQKSFVITWVSTEDWLPDPGEYVLTYSSKCGQGVAFSTVCELTGARLWRGDVSWTPTHWAPLPPPPEGGE